MPELLPCPFCGGDAEIGFAGNQYVNGTWKGFIAAICERCKARATGFYYHGPEIEIPLEETVGAEKAARAWNRRVENA